MNKEIREEIKKLAEGDYQEFSKKLNPGTGKILGVRVPQLREIAKKYAKLDWQSMMDEEDIFYEETMVRGMIIGYAKMGLDEFFERFAAFVPLVDTWSVCDSVIMGCKSFEKDPERTWSFIQPYLNSDKEFEKRVGLCVLMDHLVRRDSKGKKHARLRCIELPMLEDPNEEEGIFVERTLEVLNNSFDQGYYAHMAAAWLLAEIFCAYPAHTNKFIKLNKMDEKTLNKGIQKIKESRIPTDEVKAYLEGFKRK